jgi:hypothetical protein
LKNPIIRIWEIPEFGNERPNIFLCKFSVGILLPSRMMLYYRDGFVVGILLGNDRNRQDTKPFLSLYAKNQHK